MRLTNVVRLGTLFALGGGPTQWRLRTLLGLGVLLATVSILAGTALPGIVTAQSQRAEDLTPVLGEARRAPLMAQDPYAASSRKWGGEMVTRLPVAVTPGGQGTSIPGVARLPAAGEAVVSPRLRALLSESATIKALFAGYRITGTINPSGLTSPRELRAVIGVDPASRGLQSVDSFGNSSGDAGTAESQGRMMRAVGTVCALIVLVPLVALIVMCGRLGARGRRGRIVGLRKMGLSRRSLRIVLAVEAMVVSIPAIIGGFIFYEILIATTTHIPGTDISFFRTDAQVSILPAVGVSLLLIAIVSVTTASGISVDDTLVPEVRRGSVRGWPQLRASLLGGAIAIFAFGAFSAGFFGAIGIWVATTLVVISLWLYISPSVRVVSRFFADRARHGGMLVGLRLNDVEPGMTTRVTSGIAMLLVVIAFALSFLGILNQAQDVAHYSDEDVVLGVEDYNHMLTSGEVREVGGVRGSVTIASLSGDSDTVKALDGGCESLKEIVGSTFRCPNEPGWLSTSDMASAGTESARVKLDGGYMDLPRPGNVVRLPDDFRVLSGVLLLPESVDLSGVKDGSVSGRYVIRVRGEDTEVTMAGISAHAPAVGFDFGSGGLDGDQGDFAEVSAYIVVSAAIATLIALVALLVGVVGEAPARESRIRGLARLGASSREIAYAHGLTVFIPISIGGVLSGAASILVCLGVQFSDDRASVPWAFILVCVPGSAAIGLLLAAVTFTSRVRVPYGFGRASK